MNPLDEHLATRRTFLGATAGAVGTTALSTLLARAASFCLRCHWLRQCIGQTLASQWHPSGSRPPLPPPLRPQRQASPLPLPSRRHLPCGLVRLQTIARQTQRRGNPALRERQPAPHRDDFGPGPLPGRRPHVARPTLRPARHLDQRPVAPHAKNRRRHLHRQIHLHRSDQPRPGPNLLLHRQPAARLRQHGRVDQLRPGHRKRKPAHVHRDDLARHGQEPGPADLQPPLGQRLSALDAPRRRPPRRREPRPLS